MDTMADQHTMVELLRVPTEGYVEAIVVPSILTEQFEVKHSLINMMTSDKFFGLEKDNPHDRIRWGNPSVARKRTIAYKDLLRACPHHGFTELHQLDTFYNALNPADQDSLNYVAGGNLLERRTQDVLTIIGNKSKCLAAGGNTFLELRDNIQGYAAVAAVNYNQGNSGYHPSGVGNQIRPPVVPLSELEKVKRMNEANMKAMQTQINNVKNELRNEMKNSIQASMSNQTNELKNMMASFFQMNTASTSGSGSLPSNTIANPKGELKAITTRSGIFLDGPSVPFPPLFINPEEDERVEETLIDQDLAEYTIKVPPPFVQKPKPPSQRNIFVHQRFTFPANLVIVDYESDPRVSLILGRPFLLTARTLIDVHGEEMILHDSDERLTLNVRHDTSSYSNQPQKESINMINVFNDSSEDFLKELFTTNRQSGNPTFSSHPKLTSPEVKDDIFDPEGGNVLPKKLLDLDSTKDLHPRHHANPLSGSTTSSTSLNQLLEEFADELALITFPPGNDDLLFDINNIVDLNDNLADTMSEMFTEEHALDYSSPPLYDEYDDDLFKVESDTEYFYDYPFDSNGEKIKESKLLIDDIDRPSDFLPSSEYDSFLSEDFSKVDAFPSTKNKDKLFNLGILIQEKLFEVITRVATEKNEKKLAISHAFLMLEDFDPPLYELPSLKKFLILKLHYRFHLKMRKRFSSPGFTLLKKFILSLS
uniref:Reverse transcriptase domain-containing protein n=1 Tax=Tanacetum cinerariifolium TaxID=118510 RepID=A0A6L2MFX5_TANCI|nr:reverse transcriptase domain-containing protein [Tanacetum cinerariifolium]